MSEHTPGPWHASFELRCDDDSEAKYVLDKDKFDEIALVFGQASSAPGQREWDDESEANARLIAASPTLLQACLDIRDFLRHQGFDTRILDAAIAKATE